MEYTQLLIEHQPTVPTTEAEHKRLVNILEAYDLSRKPLTKAEKKFADLLASAILTYESVKCPPLPMQPHEALTELMQNAAMTQADLARLLGVSRATANHIVHGKQGISKAVAIQLANHFRIDVSVFLA